MVNRFLAAAGLPPVTRRVSARTGLCGGGAVRGACSSSASPGEPPMTRFVARELSTAHWFNIDAARRDLGYCPTHLARRRSPTVAGSAGRRTGMSTLMRPATDEVHIRLFTLDRNDAELERLERLLSPEELSRADRLRSRQTRNRFAAGRGLLRQILGGYLGCAPERVRLAAGEHGKPFIIDGEERSRLRFNLSHTGGQAILAARHRAGNRRGPGAGPRQPAVCGNGSAFLCPLRTSRSVQPAAHGTAAQPFSAAGPVKKPISRHAAPASANPPTASPSPFSPIFHRHLPAMQRLRENLSGGNWLTLKLRGRTVPHWPSKAMVELLFGTLRRGRSTRTYRLRGEIRFPSSGSVVELRSK